MRPGCGSGMHSGSSGFQDTGADDRTLLHPQPRRMSEGKKVSYGNAESGIGSLTMNVVSFIVKVSTIRPKTFWRISPGKYAATRGSQSIAY